MAKKYLSKGYITFRHTREGLQYLIEEKADILKAFDGKDVLSIFKHSMCDLMDGRDFYDYVDSGGIIDSDGSLCEILVDGYISNLGLAHKGLCQGKFLVDGKTFLELCDNFKIEVDWANK